MNVGKLSLTRLLTYFNLSHSYFFGLVFLMAIEIAFVSLSVFAIIPLADYILDPTIHNPSLITIYLIKILAYAEISPSFLAFAIFFIGTNLFKAISEVLLRFYILKIKYSIVRNMYSEILRDFFKARLNFFISSSHGILVNSLNKELTLVGDAVGHMATLIAQTFQLIVLLSLPFYLNSKLTSLVFVFAFISSLPFMLLRGLSYRLGKDNAITGGAAMSYLMELIGASRIILGYARQESSVRRYLEKLDKHISITLRSQVLSTAIPKLFQPMGMAALVVAFMLATNENEGNLPEIVAAMWSLMTAIPVMGAIISGRINITNCLPSFEHLETLRNTAKEHAYTSGSRIFENFNDSIELRDVCFSYQERARVLSGISMKIEAGKITALVGESGAGKSTIVDIIMGLQIHSSGSACIDGVPFSEWDINSFRNKIGYVPQDPQLFHASIRENLLWSNNNATHQQIMEALNNANALDFVLNMKDGLNSIVGDRGLRMSGGQRQKIALARALVRNPKLLILDEATSSLDGNSESEIGVALKAISKNMAVLVVAHRLSTVANADQIYVISNGTVVEEGSFVDLNKKSDGIFSQMIKQQTISS